MKFAGPVLIIFLLILSCGKSTREIKSEIRMLEYQRNADGKKFIPWLNSSNHQVRKYAVEALGRIQDSTVVSWIANRMVDEKQEVREAAAFALGQINTTESELAVIDWLAKVENQSVKNNLIEAMGKIGRNKSILPLKDQIESLNIESEKVAAISCGLLAYRGIYNYDNANSLAILLGLDRNADSRWRFAYGIYRNASPGLLKLMNEQLPKSEPMTRFYLLRTLADITSIIRSPEFKKYATFETMQDALLLFRSEEFYNTLIEVMQDSTWYVKIADLLLMGRIANKTLWPSIVGASEDPHVHVRTTALSSIAQYKNTEAEDFLFNFCDKTNNWREKGIALQHLAVLNPEKVFEIIKSDLKEQSWPENYFLMKSLQLINTDASMEKLIELANTEDKIQTSHALEILVNKPGISLSFLLEKLQLNDPSITTIIANKFAVVKDEKTVIPLLTSYKAFRAPQNTETMEAIIVALGEIGSDEAIAFLEQELRNPFPRIHNAATTALEKITGQKYELPEMQIQSSIRFDFPVPDPNGKPRIKFHTNKGNFTVELFPSKAPQTVGNFIRLVKSGFYEGIFFHRVVPTFVVQAGDPKGDGWGGPGYTIPCEYNNIFFERGVVGMAHAGKDTGGSQFFITQTPQPHLNGKHTAFGKVVDGMPVVDSIEIYDQIVSVELLQ